jgi:hypothetical protein
MVWASFLFSQHVFAQNPDIPQLSIRASFGNDSNLAPDVDFSLQLNRPITPSEGRLAVLLADTDLTALFVVQENALRYGPPALPLPVGQSDLIVYLVSPHDEWKVIARFPLRIAVRKTSPEPVAPTESTPKPRWLGFEKFSVKPTLMVGYKSQMAESHFPANNRFPRSTFFDGITRAGLRTEIQRGPFNLQGQFDVTGSSYQREALRFGVMGVEAPEVDLSSYNLQLKMGGKDGRRPMVLTSGQSAFGTHKYMMTAFNSRGLSLLIPLGTRSDVTLSALNGTNIVGFGNFFGIEERQHQIQSATWGFEFLKKRPGGLRLESSYLNGSLLPRNNFNQTTVTDSERSHGWGVRLLASDPAQRLRIESGFARSKFTNPADPLLNQGFAVVPVEDTTRNARYVEANYDLFRELKLSERRKLNLTMILRHERVDPLYRSIAAPVQADLMQNQVDLVASIGEASVNASFGGFDNNLDELPSVLTTLTRRRAFNVSAPLTMFLTQQSRHSMWLPRVGYGYDRTHQFAPTVPVNGGFDGNDNNLSFIPNQVSINQNFSADWQLTKWRFGYRFNQSFQDNRQVRREFADLLNRVSVVTVGYTISKFEATLELHAESAANGETVRTDRTLRFNSNVSWRMTPLMTLTASGSNTTLGDLRHTAYSRNTEFSVQWSRRLVFKEQSRFRKMQAQFFIIYANRYASAHDTVFGSNSVRKTQTLNSGLSFSFM